MVNQTNHLLKNLILSCRPKQWTKNLLVFLALFFSLNEAWEISNPDELVLLLSNTIISFLIFCFLSSSVYLINDSIDKNKDILHPQKFKRPIASGHISIKTAIITSIILCIPSIISAFFLNKNFAIVSMTYFSIMIFYSIILKKFIILDVLIISLGFVLRTISGAIVIDVPISNWLYICTGIGALFIALSKRRSELDSGGENITKQRQTLQKYNTRQLDISMLICGVLVLISYILYTIQATNLPYNNSMLITVPFVFLGLIRYSYLTIYKKLGQAPENIITSDIVLISIIILWLVTSSGVLYIFRN